MTRSTDDAEATSAADPGATSDAAGPPAEPPQHLPTRPRRIGLFAIVAGAALVLDVLSKVLVAANLPDTHQPVKVLGGLIYLDQARNSGAAFSLGTGFTIVLTIVALAVVGVIIRTASRMRSVAWAIALGLVLGGALGNLGDRIFRAPGVGRGRVVDWISAFGPDGAHWPIFNIADSAIVCGAILAALISIIGIDLDGTKNGRA